MSGRILNYEWAAILRADPCSYCGNPGGTIDHIRPLAGYGGGHWTNLAGACQRCNGEKSDLSLLLYLAGARRESVPGVRRRDLPDLPPIPPLKWSLAEVFAEANIVVVVEQELLVDQGVQCA